MDKPTYGRDDYMIHHIEYGPYEREIRAPSSNNSSMDNLALGYHRRSASSTGGSSTGSSSAGSGKQLVKPSYHYPSPQTNAKSLKGRLERGYNFKEDRHFHRTKPTGLEASPSIHKNPPKFFLGPPSPPASSLGYHTPQRLSPSPNHDRLQSNQLVPPGFQLQLHPGLLSPPTDKNSKISSLYDASWSLQKWCAHKNCGFNNQKCSQCQLKEEETSSTCSSVNPPPTFTVSDNYRPVRRKPPRCGAIFIATVVFSSFVLILIAGFILYVEIVLKQAQYVPDPM